MWYPPSQQPARWHPYPSAPPPPPQHQQSYSRTSYYSPTDDSSFGSHRTPSTNYMPAARTDENDSLGHYQHRTRADDVYVTGTDYYVTSSPRDEMSTSPTFSYSNCNPHWNPVIAAPIKPTTPPRNPTPLPHVRPSSSSSSACWDWLLYPPELYPQLYIASSSFIQHSIVNEDFDLVASLPSWLLVLLYPSMKSLLLADDENESDQEISSLQKTSDEPFVSSSSITIDKNMTHVSSTDCFSTETITTSHAQQHPPQLSSNRSSTPDTDDGYQSASDASRSDYSQQSSCAHYDHHHHPPSKDDLPTMNGSSMLMPKRISYAAAAVKPMETSKTCPSPSSTTTTTTTNVKTKNTSSNTPTSHDPLSSNGQKLKFIAPRFERMHHAKQYPSTTMNHSKDSSSSSSTSLLNRTSVRSHNNHNHHPHHQPRNHLMNSTRRR